MSPKTRHRRHRDRRVDRHLLRAPNDGDLVLSSLAREHVADTGEVPSGRRRAVDRGDDVAFLKSGRGGRGIGSHRGITRLSM